MNKTKLAEENFKALQDWAIAHDELRKNLPTRGTILTAYNPDEEVKIILSLEEGKRPFAYSLAFIPSIVGQRLSWFCQEKNSKVTQGLYCVLTESARRAVVRKFGLSSGTVGVKSLTVLAVAESKTSLICEVNF